jgi:SAM-dependent MidA family methyltransferase
MTERRRPAVDDDGLPAPGAEALDSSQRLSAILHARIQAAGGWIPFSDWMDAALYEPALGYYSGGATKLGRDGDFITAPTLSPLFAWTLAAEAARLPQAADTILELGPGDGALTRDLLSELDRLGHAPRNYLLLEPSASLAARQQATLTALPAHLQSRVRWLSSLPGRPFDGLILANEVVDALPVRRFRIGDGGRLEELGVHSTGRGFSWEARPLDDHGHPVARAVAAITAALGHALPAGFVSEYAPGAGALLRSLADCLRAGVILITDYGALREAYYHPERASGTLRAYYRHHVLDDPFRLPGLQDITAHVDFSALIDAAHDAQLDVLEFCSQLRFLMGAGLPNVLEARMRGMEPIAALELAQSAKVLMLPSEMGEIFKALAVAKGLDGENTAFRVQSRLDVR